MPRSKIIEPAVRKIAKPKITEEVQQNIQAVMNLAPVKPIIFENKLEPGRMVNFLKESKDVEGFLVGFSHDVLTQRSCYQHLSVSANGETPMHEDLVTFADAFGLPEAGWSEFMITTIASHVYQVLRAKMH